MIKTVSLNNSLPFRNVKEKPFVPVKIDVLDFFSPLAKTVDINGDDCPDIPHGNAVEIILKEKLDFKPIIKRRDIVDYKNLSSDSDNDFSYEKIFSHLDKIEKSDSKYVNMSFGENYVLEETQKKLDEYLESKHKKKIKLTPDNLLKHRNTLVKMISHNEKDDGKLLAMIRNIAAKKKVFIAGGNDGKDCFDMECLAKGVINVGSMEKDFKNVKDSADNSLINVFAKDSHHSKPIRENGTVTGFDLTDDGIKDVDISQITGFNIINKFVNKKLNTVKAQKSDYKKIASSLKENPTRKEFVGQFGEKLLSIKELAKHRLIEKQDFNYFSLRGSHVDAGTFFDMPKNRLLLFTEENNENPVLIFKIGKDKKIKYDPYMDKKEIAAFIDGTSFATPVALAQTANEDYKFGRLTAK